MDTVYVVEELDDVIETFCKKIGVSVIGKELFPWIGEFSQTLLKEKLLHKTDFKIFFLSTNKAWVGQTWKQYPHPMQLSVLYAR